MADNTRIVHPTVPGDLISTEDIDGVKVPRSKIVVGNFGTDDGDVSLNNPMPVIPSPVVLTSANYTRSGTGAPTNIRLDAVEGQQQVLGGVCWSYTSGTPDGYLLIINQSSATVFRVDITESGPGVIPFNPPVATAPDGAFTIILSSGGSGITGTLNILSSWSIPNSPP